MKRVLLFVLVLSVYFLNFVEAQTPNRVTVNTVIVPPYSTKITDYLIYENRAVITVTAFGNAGSNYQIYFQGSVVGDNGVSIKTKDNYYPSKPFELQANIPKRMSGDDLRDYFDWDYVDIAGVSTQTIIRTNGIPEGNYKICFQAYDYLPRQPIGTEQCSAPIHVADVNPPRLIAPMCDKIVNGQNPQSLIFSWVNSPGAPINTQFTLTILELYEGQNPNDAFATNALPYFEKTINSPTYLYNAIDPELRSGKKYAWRVKAFDPNDKVYFKNDGVSEVCTFDYNATNTTSTDSSKVVTIPVSKDEKLIVVNPVNTGTLQVSNSNNFLLNWLTKSQYDYFNTPHPLQSANQIDGKDLQNKAYNDMLHQTKDWKFKLQFAKLIDYNNSGMKFNACKKIWSVDTITHESFMQSDIQKIGEIFKNNQKYVVRVSATDTKGHLIQSDDCIFTFKIDITKTVAALLHFKTEVHYKFDGAADEYKMESTPFGIYDVWYVEDANGLKYRIPSNVFNSPVDAMATGTTNWGTAFFDISKDKLDTKNGYGLIKDAYSTTIQIGNQNIAVNGKLYHSLYLLPLSPYYPISQNFIFPTFNKDVSKEESLDLSGSPLVFMIYDYDANIRLHKTYFVDGKKIVDDNSKDLIGKTIYILRKCQYPSGVPTGDYNIHPDHDNLFLNGQQYFVIAKKQTILAKDKKGNDAALAEFKHLTCNWLPTDKYFIYVDGEDPSTLTEAAFTPKQPMNLYRFHYFAPDYDDYLVSPTPPPSTISGKLIYKYADDGEIETYPLAYQNISIRTYFIYHSNEFGAKDILCRSKNELKNQIGITYDYNLDEVLQGLEDQSKVCSTTQTDNNGNFSFNVPYDFIVGSTLKLSTGGAGEFKFAGGSIKHVLRVVIDNQYFCSPDSNINISPFSITNINTLTCLIKSFGMRVFTNSTQKNINWATSENGSLSGVKIKVIRYNPDLVYNQYGIPKNEGMQSSDALSDSDLGKTVSIDYSANGSAKFKRMIRHKSWSPEDHYYVRGETDKSSTYAYLPATTNDLDWSILGKTSKLGDKNANDIFNDEFNSEYKYVTISVALNMPPDFPRIEGRLVNAASANKGLPGGKIWINKIYTAEYATLIDFPTIYSDDNGQFMFNNILPIYDANSTLKNQPNIISFISKDGYYNYADGNSLFVNVTNGIKWGQRINLNDIAFQPNSILGGTIKDEDGNNVEAFLRVGNDMDDMDASGFYFIPAPTGKNQKLYVLPLDPKYFADTFDLPEIKGAATKFDVVVKIRKHRICFAMQDESGKPIPNGKITFVDLPNTPVINADAMGHTPTFTFFNIATKHFNLKLECMGYATKYISIDNTETKAGCEGYNLKMSKGNYCYGYITLEGKAMTNAIVYIKMGAGQPLLSTVTDNQGFYFLGGIPSSWFQFKTEFVIYANDANALLGNGSGTIQGDAKTILIKSGVNAYQQNFDLKTIKGISFGNLLGFPIMVEKFVATAKDNSKGKISGIISLDNNNTTYKPILSNTQISFADVEVEAKTIPTNKPNINLTIGVPVNDSIELSLKELKVKANDAFNLLLFNNANQKLKLYALNKTSGTIESRAKIIDNTFNVPSSYLKFDDDQFYLYSKNGTKKNARAIYFTTSKYDEAAGKYQMEISVDTKLYVADASNQPIHFSYLEFDAQSTADAYLQGDKIKLPVMLSTSFPEGGGLDSIKAGNVTLHPGYFEPVQGNTPLTFKFEKWSVIVNNWTLDHTQGGFASSDATFKTGVVDVPCSQFILKAHHLPYFDNFKMSNITLGGLLPLNVNDNTTKHIGYDLQTGTDQKPHWKISLVGTDANPAASVDNIPGSSNPLQIQMLSLISNGEALVTLPSGTSPLKFKCGVNFQPSTFSMPINGNGVANGFALVGNLQTGIPRTQDNITATLQFSGSVNNLKMTLNPLNFSFEGKGFVKFTSSSSNQIINDNEFRIDGTVEEPGKLSPIKVTLHRQASNIFIQENNPAPILFGDKKMKNVKCNMQVENTDWGMLSFDGIMDGFDGMGKNDEDKHLHFTVYGEIKADGQQVKMDGINTPFGQMQMTFDLANARIVGVLNLDGIDFGGTSLSGQANILMDKGGFYIAASAQVTTPAIGSYSGGVLIGKYKDYSVLQNNGAISTLLANAYNKSVPCTFQQDGLTGFMVVGKRELKPIPDFHLNLVVVDVSLVAGAGVDARVYMNLANGFAFGVGVTAFAKVDLMCSSITCTEVDGHVDAQAMVTALFENKNLFLEGCGSVTLGIHGSQCIPTLLAGCISPCLDLGKDFSIAYKIHANTQVGMYQEMLWGSTCTNSQDCPPK